MATAASEETAIIGPGAVFVPNNAQRKPSTTPTMGFEPVNRAPGFAQQAAGISDGRRKHPGLNQERHGIADIPKLDIHCREPEPHSQAP